MRKYFGLTKRNLLVYFKDIQSVCFSMLTPIIILILYILFLKDTFTATIEGSAQALEGFLDAQDVGMLANGLLLSGILGTSVITVSYNALTTIVRDKENRVDYDICSTPLGRNQIILSYFTASAVSSFAMSSLILLGGLLVLRLMGDLYLTAADILKLCGVTLTGSLSATSLLMLIFLFFKTTSACAAFQGIVSAAVGFIIGAYIPLSQFSKAIQNFCNLFPGTGVTVLYRNALLNPLLKAMDKSLNGIDGGVFVKELKESFTFELHLFGQTMGEAAIIFQITAAIILCTAAIMLIYQKAYKRK